jgi:hypothetical protein
MKWNKGVDSRSSDNSCCEVSTAPVIGFKAIAQSHSFDFPETAIEKWEKTENTGESLSFLFAHFVS